MARQSVTQARDSFPPTLQPARAVVQILELKQLATIELTSTICERVFIPLSIILIRFAH